MRFRVETGSAIRVIAGATTDVARQVRSISQDLFDAVKKKTPVRSGRAKRGWTKRASKLDFTISNDVPYTPFLDAGRSKKAPKGMTRPALREVANKYRRK